MGWQCLDYGRVTFVEREWSFCFYDFVEAVEDAIVDGVGFALSLESDLDDFEGLHDEYLWPSCVEGGVPVTMPLKKAKNLSQSPISLLTILINQMSYLMSLINIQ